MVGIRSWAAGPGAAPPVEALGHHQWLWGWHWLPLGLVASGSPNGKAGGGDPGVCLQFPLSDLLDLFRGKVEASQVTTFWIRWGNFGFSWCNA